ncbi:DUF2497 domain-containing protein, partial [Rhizobium sp. PRIMUS64]|nr:DUF2497 domain-containing protein [Rhizobium sp. PRIMUS64]
MAQPSVAREPSMEEILASIRQIIESNEPGAGKAISASLPPVYGADEDENGSEIHLTVDDTYAGVEFPEPVMRSSDPRFVAANSAGTSSPISFPAAWWPPPSVAPPPPPAPNSSPSPNPRA